MSSRVSQFHTTLSILAVAIRTVYLFAQHPHALAMFAASNAKRCDHVGKRQNGHRRAFHLPPQVLARGRSRSNDRTRTRGGKGREGDRARAGSTDRSRSAAKKVWMNCIHQVPLARVAPGSRLTPAKEDEAGRCGSDAAAKLRRLCPAAATAIATPRTVSQCREPYRFVPSTLAVHPHS